MQDDLRLPRVLDLNLRETARAHPLELSLDLQLRACSTGKMTLPDEDPRLNNMPFVDVYTMKGSAGIFRVYDSTEPVSGTRSYTLRHAIDTLRDSLWREKTDFEGTVEAFLEELLSWQNVAYWQLGACADTGDYKRDKIDYDHLDKLLDELRNSREGYYFSYDFSTTPWTLHFLALSGTVDAELRPSRNLTDASLRRTRNGMINRLHLFVGDKEPIIYNDTAHQAAYGISEGTAAVTAEEAPDASAWAARFLADHGAPVQSVSGDAFEIVKATGEAWDALDLGKLARVAANRPGFPITLPVETLRYEGLAGAEPEKVRADLQRRLPKFSERLASAQKKADSAGDESEKSQNALDELTAVVARLNERKPGRTPDSLPFNLYVGASQPDYVPVLWFKPGDTLDADAAYPCEVKYIPGPPEE